MSHNHSGSQQSNQLKCSLCFHAFTQLNYPRFIPSCDHSICNTCLKAAFHNGKKFIECGFCHVQQSIQGQDMESFPKNIKLTKIIKEQAGKQTNHDSNNSNHKPSNPANIRTSQSHSQSQWLKQNEIVSHSHDIQVEAFPSRAQICPTHNKQLQIICLNDFIKLCPLCAVFGPHKQHELQTIAQISGAINSTNQSFSKIKLKRVTLSNMIKNKQFKSQISSKLSTVKETHLKKIKQNFSILKQAVQSAQKNAYEDLNKILRELYDKVNLLVKEQSQFQQLYDKWQKSIENAVKDAQKRSISFEDKVKAYYSTPITSMKEGNFYLSQIQAYLLSKKSRILLIPGQIVAQNNDGIIKDIYNWFSVRIDEKGLYYSDMLISENISRIREVQGILVIQQQQESQSVKMNNNTQYQSVPTALISDIPKTQPPSNMLSPTNMGSPQIMSKKPIQVQFSSSQNFLSPSNKNRLVSPNVNIKKLSAKKQSPKSRRQSKSVPKQPPSNAKLRSKIVSPKKQQKETVADRRKQLESGNTEEVVEAFCSDDRLDTLDLSSFQLLDNQIGQILEYIWPKKKIKCLKLSKNRLTNQGFLQIVSLLKYTTNLNLSQNLLTQQMLVSVLKHRERLSSLRILNLSSNKVNERKGKNYVDQLKKVGIIVTL